MTFNYESYAPHYGWHESVYDDAREIGQIIGVEIGDIYFSGFSSQGDGACFTGSYSYAKGAAKRIREYAPLDKELHGLADRLQTIQARHFYQLTASISRGHLSNHYSHSGTMSVDVEDARDSWRDIGDADDDIRDVLREFADWIYARLESDYEYQQAWELARGWQEAGETAASEKESARELIRDMRAAMKQGATGLQRLFARPFVQLCAAILRPCKRRGKSAKQSPITSTTTRTARAFRLLNLRLRTSNTSLK